MAKLTLTYGGERHFDRTHALETGEVAPQGIDLIFVGVGARELFRRMARYGEFDVAEMSVSTLAMMISRGDDRLVGLPFFPSRHFRHRQIYVNVDSGIERPEDLVGKRVGVPDYQMTAALWIRAFLQHDHGVLPDQLEWLYGGLNGAAEFAERLAHEAPPGVSLTPIAPGTTLGEMLDDGRLDAVFASQPPRQFREGSPRIRRLFTDYRRVEREYYERTGFYPIMHTIVLRRDVYEANRWAAVSLFEAFVESRRVGLRALLEPDVPPVTHPWWHDEIDEVLGLFGGDPFRGGFRNNLPILEAMTRYSGEQGLTVRAVHPRELFAPEVLDIEVP